MAADLERILPREIDLRRRFWLSTHREVADSARTRIVRAWLFALVAANKDRMNPGAAASSAEASSESRRDVGV